VTAFLKGLSEAGYVVELSQRYVRLTTASVQPRVAWRPTVMDGTADPDAASRDPACPPNAAIREIVALNIAYCPWIRARRAGRAHAGGR
jgi:hypothetical protein